MAHWVRMHSVHEWGSKSGSPDSIQKSPGVSIIACIFRWRDGDGYILEAHWQASLAKMQAQV